MRDIVVVEFGADVEEELSEFRALDDVDGLVKQYVNDPEDEHIS